MILGIAPRFDEATEHSFDWFLDLVDQLGEERWYLLLGEEATRSSVEKALKRLPVDICVFYDHGTEEGLVAQDGHEYCLDKRNLHLVAGKVIYTLACLAGKDYGVEAYNKYDCIFWGYDKEFGFTIGDDEYLFKECANFGLIYKLKNRSSWKEAYEKTREKFNDAIKKAKSIWSKMWLRHDRDALVCYAPDMPPPKPRCLLRRIAIKLFGEVGRKIRRTFVLGVLLQWLGIGLCIHDFIKECQKISNPYTVHGFWWGIGFIIVGFFMLTWNYVKWLVRKYR